MGLYKDSGLVSASLNRILDCMKVMMKEAVRKGYANADPAAGVESFTEKFKVRGVITPDEIHALFSPKSLSSVWKGEQVYFAAAILGVATGLRRGEIRGFRIQDVHPQCIAVSGRFVVHHTPTHSSWLNLVERWFSEITTKRIRHRSWNSVKELERAIMEYIHHWNESGKRFVWAKSSEQILRKVRKAAQI